MARVLQGHLMRFFYLLIPLAFLVAPTGAASAATPSCSDLAAAAGATMGVPDGLLPAIALVESGTGGAPWPWTLNEGGKGMYFKTKAEALSYLKAAIARGVTNIDVGCMQLNYRWHQAGFASPEDMLDPQRNTTYAAVFLQELQKRLGSWQAATAHYHSTDADRGGRYVEKVVAAAGQAPVAPDLAADTALQPADAGAKGPLLLASGRALIAIDPGSSAGYRALLEVAAKDAAAAMIKGPKPELLARDDASPRLQKRWEAILAARQHLFPDAKSIP
jgi:hypothetical protein